jgi:hypothetical protein
MFLDIDMKMTERDKMGNQVTSMDDVVQKRRDLMEAMGMPGLHSFTLRLPDTGVVLDRPDIGGGGGSVLPPFLWRMLRVSAANDAEMKELKKLAVEAGDEVKDGDIAGVCVSVCECECV